LAYEIVSLIHFHSNFLR